MLIKTFLNVALLIVVVNSLNFHSDKRFNTKLIAVFKRNFPTINFTKLFIHDILLFLFNIGSKSSMIQY